MLYAQRRSIKYQLYIFCLTRPVLKPTIFSLANQNTIDAVHNGRHDILNLILIFTTVICLLLQFTNDRRSRDRMVVGFIATYATSVYQH